MKKNILVVDDSALMRRVICDIINSEGTFQATDVCRDGLAAYEKLKTNPEFKKDWKEFLLRPLLQEMWKEKHVN